MAIASPVVYGARALAGAAAGTSGAVASQNFPEKVWQRNAFCSLRCFPYGGEGFGLSSSSQKLVGTVASRAGPRSRARTSVIQASSVAGLEPDEDFEVDLEAEPKRPLRPVVERFKLHHEKYVTPERLKGLGVEIWWNWDCSPGVTTFRKWLVDEMVVWGRQGSTNSTKVNLLRLVVAASSQDSQNVDFPVPSSKRKKRASLIPKQSRRRKLPDLWDDPSLKPPANGLLVDYLIPIAHDVMQAKAIVTKGVRLLLDKLSILACRYCTETHVGLVGHNLRTCTGPKSSSRNSRHDWVKGTIDDILVPIDAYHLADRLAKPVTHEERFDVERIPAIDELCIQAGVDIPGHPTKRYTEPVIAGTRRKRQDAGWLGGVQFTFYNEEGSYLWSESSKYRRPLEDKSRVSLDDVVEKQIDASEEFRIDLEDSEPYTDQPPNDEDRVGPDATLDEQIDGARDFQTVGNIAVGEQLSRENEDLLNRRKKRFREEELLGPLLDINSQDDLQTIAQKTLLAWERMRGGCKKLMIKYRVLACGYCPEVHVGPRGHKGKACGAFKHQWRDGKHGWQDASVDELIPPQHVWHLRDRLGPPLENRLRRYYGRAPAIVEICVQAGAPIPESCAPMMRLDIAIPTMEEFENVI